MSSRASAGIDVVKREEKESKLKQFIEDCLAIAAVSAARSAGESCLEALLVVRSGSSPVARALASVIEHHVDPAISVKAVIAMSDLADPAAAALLDRISGEIRILRDERLLNAHEQLVLGPSLTWVGDCMRRDPEKRDAYEFYGREADTAGAAWARTSFDRLWALAEPMPRAVCSAAVAEEAVEAEGFDILVTPEPQPVVRPSTRH